MGTSKPAFSMARRAKSSCSGPPSIRIRSGRSVNLPSAGSRPAASSSARSRLACSNRRVMTSFMEAKSFAPTTVLIRKWRYSFLAGMPSMNTTIDATDSTPCVLEMS